MKPTLKTLFVFNRSTWTTIPFKVQQIKDFFSPKVDLLIDIKHTSFTNIPFETVNTIDGTGHQDGTDVPGHSETVQNVWLDNNVVIPMAKGYDIVVFVLSNPDKQGHITSAGIRGDRDNGAVECIIFGGEENWRTYVNGVDIGNGFVVFTCHEISHAIYMILAKKDNTHLQFYSGHPERVLEDFDFPVPNNAELKITLIKRALELARQLLAILLNKQKEMPIDTIPVPPKPPVPEPKPPVDKIKLFCDAIQRHEGYYPPKTVFENGVDKYPKGTPAWRNKNPGNARYVGQAGAIGKDASNFAIFPTYEVGYAYLYKVIENTCKGLSKVRGAHYNFYEFFGGTPAKNYQDGYAPSEDNNDPRHYAEVVAKSVGVLPTTKMRELL